MQTKLKSILFYIIGAILVLGGTIFASSLSPTVDVSTPSHLYTMEDIYQRLGNLNYTPSVHTVSITSSPTDTTMHDLTEIWNNFPTISADSIATGTTVMGVTGSMYGTSSPDYVLTTAGVGAGDVILPDASDVRKGVTYGPNGSLTGEASLSGSGGNNGGGSAGIDSGLIAHYKMNDDLAATSVIDNVNGYNGALNVNTADRSIIGEIDKALEFRGTDIVRIPYSSNLNLSNKAFSIFLWLHMDSGIGQPILISQENGWAFYVTGDGGSNPGTFTFYLGDQVTNVIGGAGVFSGGTHHVGVSFDGVSTYTFWVDDVGYPVTGQPPITDNGGDILIGNDPRLAYENYWEDDVRFYNRDMSGSQSVVDAIWNGGAGTEN